MQISLGGKVMEKQMTTAEKLLEEIAEVIAENFVATYEKQGASLTIRSVGGKTFRMTVEEI